MAGIARKYPSSRPSEAPDFCLRRPHAGDGKAVHALVAACPPLDRNSLYLNLLQCTHFAGTCVLAERGPSPDAIGGFISGYLLPEEQTTLFIWQVAIAEHARGHALAKRMLLELLSRPACSGVTKLQTTVMPSNGPSWALFRSLSRALDAQLTERVLFDRERHLDGVHESEVLVTIGPFAAPRGQAQP